MTYARCLVLCLIYLFSFQGLASVFATSSGQANPPNLSPNAQQELLALIAAGKLGDLRWPDFSDYRGHVKGFYSSGSNTLAWVNNGGPTSQAIAVVATLQKADDVGLNAEDYDGSRWAARLSELNNAKRQPSESEQVHFDLAITVSLMRYISDLHIGRVNPRTLAFELNPTERKYDLPQLLRERIVNATDVNIVLTQVEPPFEGYRRTQKALREYLRFARENSNQKLPAVTGVIHPGDRYEGTPRLAQLLKLVGDLPPGTQIDPSNQMYKGGLVDAVKRFQRRHGMNPDGNLDQQTIDQLNVPLSQRAEQLQLTLERWRWIPFRFPRQPIVVNIPEFRLRAFGRSGDPDLTMIVAVGRAYNSQTPVFQGDISYMVFHPYWNVTPNIQHNELVPEIEKDRSYLGKNDYEVIDRAGKVVPSATVTDQQLAQLRAGTLRLRQKPGPKNDLGLVKFMFPNTHNVYLHGTPEPQLFSRTRRDFSHGCIRLSDPPALAQWVLRNDPSWTRERIIAAMNGREPQTVKVAPQVPVLIIYGTAVVEADGEVSFYQDIYGHDAALRKALAKGYPYKGW
jgi:L,D-transpeptidase YcbB